MNAEDLKWVVSALIALGGTIAFLIRRHDAKKDPLPRQSAEMAMAVNAANVVESANLRLEAEVRAIAEALARERLRNDGNEIRNEELEQRIRALEAQRRKDSQLIEDQATEIAGLQRRVAGMYEDRDDLVRYIKVLQSWISAGAKPPAPAIPEHLADVLPAWVPVDGAEPPERIWPTEATD